MNRAPSLLAFSFLLAACGSVPAPVPEDPILEWDRELPAGVRLDDRYAEKAWWKPVRILDADTGLPVPGARVDNWHESGWPGAEPWESCLVQSAVADEDGYVLMRNRVDYGFWFYVDAEGYAPLGVMSFEGEHRIRRGRDLVLKVRDWLERPVPGAVVEYILGCGHTPNARVETTDGDGRAVLRCIDLAGTGRVWIRAEGIEGYSDAYFHLAELPREGEVSVVVGEPGPAVSGLVLHHDGSPAANAYVGTESSFRGPWTATGADGTFRLLGAPPWTVLTVDAWPPPGSPEGTDGVGGEFQSVPGARQVVRLPPPGAGADSGPMEAEAALRVTVRSSGVSERHPLRVVAVRASDGRAVREVIEAQPFKGALGVLAETTLSLPPGTWTVTAGTPAGLLAPGTKEVVLGAEGGEVALWLVENPVYRPAVLERRKDGSLWQLEDPDEEDFRVVTAKESEDATPTLALDGTIHVPEEGPFAVVYEPDPEGGWKARALFPDGLRGGAPALVLPPPVDWEAKDEAADRPHPGAFPEERLTVLYPDGSPARFADVMIYGLSAAGGPREVSGDLDETGSLACVLRSGDRLEIERPYQQGADPTLPVLHARIDGPGPWTLQWPSTEITLRVLDPEGDPVDGFTWYPGYHGNFADTWIEGSTLVLRGAPTGPLRFWIHADGWRARDIRLSVTAGEKREVVVRLGTVDPEEDPEELPSGEAR